MKVGQCPVCGKLFLGFIRRSKGARCRTCKKGKPVLVIDAGANTERVHRDVSIREWLNAPPPPATRAGCVDGARPCLAYRCRHFIRKGSAETCALDVAERGGVTLETIAELFGGISHMAVSYIETAALENALLAAGDELRDELRELLASRARRSGVWDEIRERAP